MGKGLSLMYSGGLDSYIAGFVARERGYETDLIYVDFGHEYVGKELDSINRTVGLKNISTIELSSLMCLIEKRLTNQIIPSRNVLLAVIGSMVNDTVWINALDGEQNGKEHDKSERFFVDTSELLSFTNEFFQTKTVIKSPFKFMSKAQTILWALRNGIEKIELFETVSCYDGKEEKCGTCLTCYKRYTAFLLNNIQEPGYLNDPLLSEYAKDIDIAMMEAIKGSDYSRFNIKRTNEWLMLKAGSAYEI